MNDSPKLSVIIPLYNAGEHFAACMDSLLAQTWTALEIIIVNDGSTDNSASIAQAYADAHSHIRVIHQPNAGASVARNRGVEAATGDYVAFVDADDLLYPRMYETLMGMALRDDLDVAQCNADWSDRSSGHTWLSIPTDRLTSTGVMTGPDWLRKALATRRWTHVVWMGVYRLSLIRDIKLTFVPGLHHQDILWTTEFMFNARRARYTQEAYYKYFLHNQSVSRVKRQGTQHAQYQRHYIKITRLLDKLNNDYANKIPVYPEFREQVTREALRVCHSVRKEKDNDIKQIIIADIFSSGMYKRLIKNVRTPKLAYQAMLWSYRLYRWRDKSAFARRAARRPIRVR
ncbi:glycosyltransferase [Siccibacter turicensis]|uniref:glycosyltransferase n=1 Tax=Siccibacter turicensis TaxID=357233 RepID=UPI0023F3A2FD|nr:glycosyltransferase [Siccibacter turicensis]